MTEIECYKHVVVCNAHFRTFLMNFSSLYREDRKVNRLKNRMCILSPLTETVLLTTTLLESAEGRRMTVEIIS